VLRGEPDWHFAHVAIDDAKGAKLWMLVVLQGDDGIAGIGRYASVSSGGRLPRAWPYCMVPMFLTITSRKSYGNAQHDALKPRSYKAALRHAAHLMVQPTGSVSILETIPSPRTASSAARRYGCVTACSSS
jgi:hypothetical protein